MLKKHITDFISYCKIAAFSINSIKALHARLQDFAVFVDEQQIDSIKGVGYGHLSGLMADFKAPSVHKKKARVWSLHQFFHHLTFTNTIKKNIALSLTYPKIEKTVPHFLTIEEFNRIIEHFILNVESSNGLRNLVLILMLGLLGLRTATVVGLDVEHIDTETGLAWITEKGRRQRQLALPKILNTLLEIYVSIPLLLPQSIAYNSISYARLTEQIFMAAFVRVLAQKVTAEICPK